MTSQLLKSVRRGNCEDSTFSQSAKETSDTMFYPWVMYLLTVRITEAFGLPKPSLFCNVQRDVASLPSYSKLNLN